MWGYRRHTPSANDMAFKYHLQRSSFKPRRAVAHIRVRLLPPAAHIKRPALDYQQCVVGVDVFLFVSFQHVYLAIVAKSAVCSGLV